MNEAALYEVPFEYVKEMFMPERIKNKMKWRAENIGGCMDTRPDYAPCVVAPLHRYIGTHKVAKHRPFVWLTGDMLPSESCHCDCQRR